MQILLPLMMAYAAVGLILSLTVHVLSLFGIDLGGQTLFFALHIGIFPLWFAVILISQRALAGQRIFYMNRKNFWNIMFVGCPDWIKYLTNGFFIYAIVNFIIFIVMTPTVKQTGGAPSAVVWHGFSGHWMAFYSAGLAISTSLYRRGIDNLTPRCPNGHPVAFGDAFCPTCGVRLNTNQSVV
jgi:hypothetical protein